MQTGANKSTDKQIVCVCLDRVAFIGVGGYWFNFFPQKRAGKMSGHNYLLRFVSWACASKQDFHGFPSFGFDGGFYEYLLPVQGYMDTVFFVFLLRLCFDAFYFSF